MRSLRHFDNDYYEDKIQIFREITESGVQYGIIGAYNDSVQPSKNWKRTSDLIADIKERGYYHLHFHFGFNYPDNDVESCDYEQALVLVTDIPLKELLVLGRKYGQELVIFGDKDEVRSYDTRTGEFQVGIKYPLAPFSMCSVLLYPGTFNVNWQVK